MNGIYHQHADKITGAIIVILLSISLWQLASASWIHGKAFIAQQLLNHSWQKTLLYRDKNITDRNNTKESKQHKPWPWADTWPVAKLSVPKLEINQIVLAGDSGSSLAFAPGYSLASASPNTVGTTLISAHRDTHFKFLKKLQINDIVYIQTENQTAAYQVYATKIADSKSTRLQNDNERQILVLATCYPFDALDSGGSLRYLVYAAVVKDLHTM